MRKRDTRSHLQFKDTTLVAIEECFEEMNTGGKRCFRLLLKSKVEMMVARVKRLKVMVDESKIYEKYGEGGITKSLSFGLLCVH